jgi:hypothetical protein
MKINAKYGTGKSCLTPPLDNPKKQAIMIIEKQTNNGEDKNVKHHETLTDLLNATEGEHYQFKEWKNKDNYSEAAKILCALANCGGGKLVLDVGDKRLSQAIDNRLLQTA